MTDLPTISQIEGRTYQPRTPDPLDFTVTPESLAYELKALRGGWSRNVWQQLGGRSVELLLWSRYFHDTPPLMIRYHRDEATRVEVETIEGGDGERFDKNDPASLARYRWSYDPARYAPSPVEPLHGLARVRAFIDAHRTTIAPAKPMRARHLPPVIRRWSVLDEGGPLDGCDWL